MLAGTFDLFLDAGSIKIVEYLIIGCMAYIYVNDTPLYMHAATNCNFLLFPKIHMFRSIPLPLLLLVRLTTCRTVVACNVLLSLATSHHWEQPALDYTDWLYEGYVIIFFYGTAQGTGPN